MRPGSNLISSSQALIAPIGAVFQCSRLPQSPIPAQSHVINFETLCSTLVRRTRIERIANFECESTLQKIQAILVTYCLTKEFSLDRDWHEA
jgi:hypothetical protein